MDRLIRLAAAMLAAALLLFSCRQTSGPESETTVVNTDTVAIDTVVVKSDTSARTQLKFDSPAEAIDYMKNSGNWERYSAGLLPRMASENLKYATRLLNSEYPRFIIVDKRRMKVLLYDRYGVELKNYGMCCAKNFGTKHKRADSRTPEGFFSVEGIYDSTDWLFTDDDGVTSKKKGQFGPRFIRISCPQTSQIGIHGTCAPWSIGSRSSHGCIRVTNENILELVELVEKGMPVIITPGIRDQLVNRKEGCTVLSVTTRPGDSPITDEMLDRHEPRQETTETISIDSITTTIVEKNEKEALQTKIPDSIHGIQ